jgi:hypothetical protein
VSQDALCCGIRRLNPFLGVTQIVELEIGRAVSTDAENWEIQLAVERPAGWGSLNRNRSERQFYRYGVWSDSEGLAHFPVHPRLDPLALHESADILISAVCRTARHRPYPLADRYELWLVDSDETPVALLAAVTKQHLTSMHRSAQWSAAAPGGDTFEATAWRRLGGDQAVTAGPRGDCDLLEARVRQRVGGARQAKWFERTTEQGADTALPELPITEIWDDADDAHLVAGYLAWLAPRLLTLPLSSATRARLEVAAMAQPSLVDRLFPLYPAVVDADLMNRLRVQARIMAASAPPGRAVR